MSREGRLHGCGFDREQRHARVKALKQAPTNRRSKFGAKGSAAAEKGGCPSYKSLKKAKRRRNKAFGADVVANHRMHEWELRIGPHRTSNLHLPHDTTADADANAASSLLLVDTLGLRHLHVSRRRPSSLEASCDPSEPDHGYGFDREWRPVCVKALKQAPTNRSKFGAKGSAAAEKAGRPSSKSLKKAKGQRNKAFGADHRMHEWELRVGPHRTSDLHLPHDTTADADADADANAAWFDLGLHVYT